jgi:hypothetical protein
MFTWEKFKTDWVDIFFPKMKDILMNALNWLWAVIKNTTTEFMFGAKGDKRIGQETRKLDRTTTGMSGTLEGISAENLKEVGAGTIVGVQGKFGLSSADAKGLKDTERAQLNKEINDTIQAMWEMSRQSDGRIQWIGFPDLDKMGMPTTDSLRNISMSDVQNPVPIIDGNISTIEDLKAFRLNKSAGITKDMAEENADLIRANLAEMSEITRSMNYEKVLSPGGVIWDWGKKFFVGDTEYTAETAKARIKQLAEEIAPIQIPYETVDMDGLDGTALSTDGTTPIQKDLKATGTWVAGRWTPTTAHPSQATIAAQIDNSDNRVTTVMNKNEMALRAGNDYWTARLFLEDNLRAVNS